MIGRTTIINLVVAFLPMIKVNIILLGDGMAGKTSIIKKFAELLYLRYARQYEQFLLQNGIPSYEDWLNDQELPHHSDDKTKLSYSSYFNWAAWQYNLIRFDEWLKDLGVSLKSYVGKDTTVGTIGLDTIDLAFPHQTGAVHVTGYDLGGQNIYDQIREVMTGLSTPETFLITVFDSTRLMSCEHSVRQLTSNLEKIKKKQQGLPRVIIVFNKIDLKEYLKSHQWQQFTVHYLHDILMAVRHRSLTYVVPHLVMKGKTQAFRIGPDDYIGIEHLEALIYHAFSKNDPNFGLAPFTEDNAKAMAREIAMQLLLIQNDDANYFNRLAELMFAMRPLAVQYIGGLAMVKGKSPRATSQNSLAQLRRRYQGFELHLRDLTPEMLSKAVRNALRTDGLENAVKAQGFPIFHTNALNGVGIMQLFNHLITKSLELDRAHHARSMEMSGTRKRRIQRL